MRLDADSDASCISHRVTNVGFVDISPHILLNSLQTMDPEIQTIITNFWQTLPSMQLDELDPEDNCPICFLDFETLLSSESGTQAGVTKLACGHIFCRKDLSEWIRSMHGSCPTCRHVFLDIRPPSSDDESDGGEYVPDPDELEEEDSFAFTSDGYTDMESNGDEMELEDDDWEDRSSLSAGVEQDTDEDTTSLHSDAEVVDVEVVADDEEDLDDSQSSDDQSREPK
ncbi:RING-type domain-containing protein [Mycena indigotica]|uniref:RING-type domain-containing protein n=1 Tax=Mycena indigotica TaxID=2126181 RepID=A0A8H6W138_9AGAR|nr:RING-type domain-containing protein [Mycena indigotica]KAF7301649.1 RING-type domain-containing protein [Mycena indigotica]